MHLPRAVTTALRLRGIDVLTDQEDASDTLDDALLLLRATFLGRVLVSQDDDLLREGHRMHREGLEFAGITVSFRTESVGRKIKAFSVF